MHFRHVVGLPRRRIAPVEKPPDGKVLLTVDRRNSAVVSTRRPHVDLSGLRSIAVRTRSAIDCTASVAVLPATDDIRIRTAIAPASHERIDRFAFVLFSGIRRVGDLDDSVRVPRVDFAQQHACLARVDFNVH